MNNYSISQVGVEVNRQNAQRFGKIFVQLAILTSGEKNGIMVGWGKNRPRL
ncbi:MAG: hypothetical protein IKE41_01810 [Clostridia bacterium]|nr:hypothetical protein [Clostridia bacterium]